MIGHLHYITSSKYELFLFNLLSVALVIINHRRQNNFTLKTYKKLIIQDKCDVDKLFKRNKIL